MSVQAMKTGSKLNTSPSDTLDTRGLKCPLPVLKARKRLQSLSPGAVLRVEATDPMAVIDFPHFCAESGHELVRQSQRDELYIFEIRKV
ncbi:MAG: sulfurtransferase TusA family protein [Alphaproteobacteria bacterium]|nr:sulfurtransferase TusA family protein [Alphaproteobacteria bacterium]